METDIRIRKTLSVLKQTLIELLNEKILEEMTVSELCEKADTLFIQFLNISFKFI